MSRFNRRENYHHPLWQVIPKDNRVMIRLSGFPHPSFMDGHAHDYTIRRHDDKESQYLRVSFMADEITGKILIMVSFAHKLDNDMKKMHLCPKLQSSLNHDQNFESSSLASPIISLLNQFNQSCSHRKELQAEERCSSHRIPFLDGSSQDGH